MRDTKEAYSVINGSEDRALGIQYQRWLMVVNTELPLGPKCNEKTATTRKTPCTVSMCDKAYNCIHILKMHTETFVFPKHMWSFLGP